jgi:hypothetical protein
VKKSMLAAALMALGFNAWGMGAADPAVWTTQSALAAPGQAQTLFAGSAPIEQALAVIVPAPWQIDLDSRVDVTRTMSWPSSSNWVTALRAACAQMGLIARIDYARQTVDVEQAPSISKPAPAVLPAAAVPGAGVVAPHSTPPLAHLAASRPVTDSSKSEPRVVGADGELWQSFVNGAGPVSLSAALLRIMPQSLAWQNTEIVGVNDAQPVSWPTGSRRSALLAVAKEANAQILVSKRGIKVEPVRDSRAPKALVTVPKTDVAVAHRAAAQPVASIKLVAGKPLSKQLQAFGAAQGWTVVWKLTQDWVVPAPATFEGSFGSAAQAVIEALAANGADVHADIYPRNKTFVVHQ